MFHFFFFFLCYVAEYRWGGGGRIPVNRNFLCRLAFAPFCCVALVLFVVVCCFSHCIRSRRSRSASIIRGPVLPPSYYTIMSNNKKIGRGLDGSQLPNSPTWYSVQTVSYLRGGERDSRQKKKDQISWNVTPRKKSPYSWLWTGSKKSRINELTIRGFQTWVSGQKNVTKRDGTDIERRLCVPCSLEPSAGESTTRLLYDYCLFVHGVGWTTKSTI